MTGPVTHHKEDAMADMLFIPSIDQRLASLIELERRRGREADNKDKPLKPTITISREFGCEAYPMAEKLKELMEQKTGEPWTLMDKGLLDEVVKNHDLSASILESLGERNLWIDDFLAIMSSRWKSDRDYYRLLSRHIVSLATEGNVIIMGRGAAIVTQRLKNCRHFRLYASTEFKTQSIARRAKLPLQEAELLVEQRQKLRDKFTRDFLDKDPHDLGFYHLVFNNDKNTSERIAHLITHYMTSG
jgi:cytidylate kinase